MAHMGEVNRPLRCAQLIHNGHVKLDRRDKLKSVCVKGRGKRGKNEKARPASRDPEALPQGEDAAPAPRGKGGGKRGVGRHQETKGTREQGGTHSGRTGGEPGFHKS